MKRKHAPLLLLVIVAILAAPAASQVGGVTLQFAPSNPQAGGDITLTATVTGGTPPITVTYRNSSDCSDVNAGTEIGSSSTEPYTVTWQNVPAGSHGVKAVATDSTADPAACDPATITVDPPPPNPPTVTINVPSGVLSDTTTYTLGASASVGAGASISSVTFHDSTGGSCGSGGQIDVDSTAPYTAQWRPPSIDGNRLLSAVARDNLGRTACDSATVTVDAGAPSAPTLNLTESGSATHGVGLLVYVNPLAAGTYTVTATTSDPDVTAVSFPGTGLDNTPPYLARYDTNDLATGTYSVTAVDGGGHQSPAAQFQVVHDTTIPAEVSVSYLDGNDDNGTIEVSVTNGSDLGGSGVNAASGLLERQLGTLADSPLGPTCINLGAWQQTTPTNTIQQLQCALYRYSISDNVGNTALDLGVAYVWFDNRDRIPPANVTNARVIFGDHVVKLTYRTPIVDFERVKIFRSIAGVDGSVRLAYNGARRIFTDRSVLNGTRYVYEIVTYDATGNRQDQGVLVGARPRSRFLLTPRDGAILRRPPRLDWKARPRARFYNVKLLRDIGPGPAREVLSKFPRLSALQLTRTWRHNGRIQRLGPGTYYWYVWPRVGARYGKLMGYQQFRVPRR